MLCILRANWPKFIHGSEQVLFIEKFMGNAPRPLSIWLILIAHIFADNWLKITRIALFSEVYDFNFASIMLCCAIWKKCFFYGEIYNCIFCYIAMSFFLNTGKFLEFFLVIPRKLFFAFASIIWNSLTNFFILINTFFPFLFTGTPIVLYTVYYWCSLILFVSIQITNSRRCDRLARRVACWSNSLTSSIHQKSSTNEWNSHRKCTEPFDQ